MIYFFSNMRYGVYYYVVNFQLKTPPIYGEIKKINYIRGLLSPKYDRERYGPKLSSGAVWSVQGRGVHGSRQEPIWLQFIYIFLRDRISFHVLLE